MANVKVMTDSVAGIPPELAEEYDITVIPAAHIIYNGTTYIDGVTLNRADAYELIRKDPDKFMTSALSPGYIFEEYRKLSANADDIVHITMSNLLSATFKTAGLAVDMMKNESPKNTIELLDSGSAAGAQGLLVLVAAKAAKAGKSVSEIADIVQKAREKTGGIMMWDTIKYVYRTGRMSKTAAKIASLFKIKPISKITAEGNIELVDRVKKREDGYKKLVKLIKEEAETDSLCFMLMHADCPEWADDFKNDYLKKEFNCLDVIISEYSPVMGYATGPGAIFVGFQPEIDLS